MDEWMAGRMNTYLLLEAFQGQHIGGDHVCLTVKRFCMDLSVSRVKFGCACMRISTCSHPPPPPPKMHVSLIEDTKLLINVNVSVNA